MAGIKPTNVENFKKLFFKNVKKTLMVGGSKPQKFSPPPPPNSSLMMILEVHDLFPICKACLKGISFLFRQNSAADYLSFYVVTL